MELKKVLDTRQNTKMEILSKNYRINYLSEGEKQTLCFLTLLTFKIVTLKPRL